EKSCSISYSSYTSCCLRVLKKDVKQGCTDSTAINFDD
ncbi:MAG: hypothetical protein ACI9FU_001635, partial [Granulosicoccus sp.]